MKEKFVSRAGEKLCFAIEQWQIDVQAHICADLGCSTGGFTDCLLQKGAQKVYAVDTGYGVLNWNLRNNPKVVVMERTNALHVTLPEPVDFISIDTGWTRQELIIPHALSLLKSTGMIVSLLKSHYEADKSWMRKGTVLPEHLPQVIEKVRQNLSKFPLIIKDIIPAPIKGKQGANQEFLMWIVKVSEN